jgi:hypothetical protein
VMQGVAIALATGLGARRCGQHASHSRRCQRCKDRS